MLPNTLSARISFEFRWKSQKTTFSMVLRNKTFYLALSLSCSVVSENIFELGPETFDYCWVGDLNSCTCTVQIGWQCFFILCPPRKVWTPRETRCSLEGVYHSKSEKKVLTNSPVAITVLQQALRNLFGPICLFLCFFFSCLEHFICTCYEPLLSPLRPAHAYFYAGSVCVSQKCCNIFCDINIHYYCYQFLYVAQWQTTLSPLKVCSLFLCVSGISMQLINICVNSVTVPCSKRVLSKQPLKSRRSVTSEKCWWKRELDTAC